MAKTDGEGNFAGAWGAMSDFSKSFMPWEDNFSKGLYLAGIECADDAVAPFGWTKWVIPGFQFVKILCEDNNTFGSGLKYLEEHGHKLAGAAQDYTDMKTGNSYICFPIKRL